MLANMGPWKGEEIYHRYVIGYTILMDKDKEIRSRSPAIHEHVCMGLFVHCFLLFESFVEDKTFANGTLSSSKCPVERKSLLLILYYRKKNL